jgi:hypothetical protein
MTATEGLTMDTLRKTEMKKIREMRAISLSLDSPDLGTMYNAAGRLMTYPLGRSLLPKTMSLLDKGDATLRRLMYRTAGRNVYGKYVPELFESMRNINPAEREQVLQVIEEIFQTIGSPSSPTEQKRWMQALEEVGHEHQPTVFGIAATLGKTGARWAKSRIRKIETISIGTIAKLDDFPERTRSDLIKSAIGEAMKRKNELLPYICEIVDAGTLKYLKVILESSDWQDRIQVARAVGRLGIASATGLVMDIVADPDWRVKQEVLESVNIAESRFSSLVRVLGYMVVDSHSRVRGQADRVILSLGTSACRNSVLQTQRKKLEKQFRTQLLRAAANNKDIDSTWLGVEIEGHPIPFISEDMEESEGISLSEISPKDQTKDTESTSKVDLLSALLQAREDAKPKQTPGPLLQQEVPSDEIDASLPPTDKFLQILKKLSPAGSKGVSLKRIVEQASTIGMSEPEVNEALSQLEKDGIIYRLNKGTIKRVDIEL